MASVRVFLAHSSREKHFAERVVAALRTPSLQPWIDSEQIFAGDDIFDSLGEGLSSMDLMIFLASAASLESEWVTLETKYAVKREIEERRSLILPFIIDDTPLSALPWFLQIRNAACVPTDEGGAAQIVQAVHTALKRRASPHLPHPPSERAFQHDPNIQRLIATVGPGDWDAAYDAAHEILHHTAITGENQLFRSLLRYIDYTEDEDLHWGALLTIEGMAQLAPWLFDRELLFRMGTHADFSVRSSAASICMEFANSAPHLVPTDLMLRLARFDEDWYVMAPATAALKTLCATRPALQRVFLAWLRSADRQEREHAASAIADIAAHEPSTLEPGELESEAKSLRDLGDSLLSGILEKALPKVQKAKRGFRFKYGL